MLKRSLRLMAYLIVSSQLATLMACGDASQSPHQTGLTQAPPAAAPGPSPEKIPVPVTPMNTQNYQPQVLPPHRYEPAPSPLVTQGSMQTQIQTFVIPEKYRRRLERTEPTMFPPPKSPTFSVYNQHLKIDVKAKSVTFNGVLKVKNKADEPFELSCQFDPTDVPWICTDLVPTNEKIAAERRFQATFKCLDTYECKKVGVKLWVVIDGVLQDPQLFQAEGFHIRRATSGDDDDDDAESDQQQLQQQPQPAQREPTAPLPPKDQSRVSQDPNGHPAKAQPLPTAPAPQIQEQVDTTSKEPIEQDGDIPEEDLDNPNIAFEITEPMEMPNPTPGKYSLPGIDKLPQPPKNSVPNQAIGSHNSGYLRGANEFPRSGLGFISRDHGSKDFGTDRMVVLLQEVMAKVNKEYPNRPPIVLASVANRTGGRLLNLSGHYHASHETGLDADVGLPSTKRVNDLWPSCVTGHRTRRVRRADGFVTKSGTSCLGSRISDQLDTERFWLFLKQVTCAEGNPVIAMFLDEEIKQHMCEFAKKSGENITDHNSCAFRTLKALYHEIGHYNHVHVRLRCPGNRDCQNSLVSLADTNGCQ